MNKHKILISKTIKSYLKQFGLKVDKEMIFKNSIVVFEYESLTELLSFLVGLSCGLDKGINWELQNEIKI